MTGFDGNTMIIQVKSVGIFVNAPSAVTVETPGQISLRDVILYLEQKFNDVSSPSIMKGDVLSADYAVLVNGKHIKSLDSPLYHNDRVFISVILGGG